MANPDPRHGAADGDADTTERFPDAWWQGVNDNFALWVHDRDPAGLEPVMEAMFVTLRYNVHGFSLPPDLVEDATQLCFARVVKRQDMFPDGPALRSWLMHLTRSSVVQCVRYRFEQENFGTAKALKHVQTKEWHLGLQVPAADAEYQTALYAQEVGSHVTHLMERALRDAHGASTVKPELLAEAIADLVINPVPAPDGNELADLLAPFWTAEKTRKTLGITRASMLGRRKAGSLLGVQTTDGDFFYPVTQFERREGRVQVRPALRRFFMALRDHDPWTVGVMMRTPAPELEGMTPLAWTRAGRDAAMLENYATLLHAEWSR